MKYILLYLVCVLVLFVSCVKRKVVERFDDGSVKLECDFRDGKKHGVCIQYYKNGNIEYEAEYKNDILDGASKFYHPNSKLHWQVMFEDGVKNGVINYYDSLGNKHLMATFKNSLLNGSAMDYYQDGSLKSKKNFNNDTLDGEYIAYYNSGNIEMLSNFIHGELKDYIEYDTLGNIIDHLLKYDIGHRTNGNNKELYVKFKNPIYMPVGMILYKYQIGNREYMLKEKVVTEDSILTYKLNFDIGDRDSVKLYGLFVELEQIDPNGNEERGVVKFKHDFVYKFDHEMNTIPTGRGKH